MLVSLLLTTCIGLSTPGPSLLWSMEFCPGEQSHFTEVIGLFRFLHT